MTDSVPQDGLADIIAEVLQQRLGGSTLQKRVELESQPTKYVIGKLFPRALAVEGAWFHDAVWNTIDEITPDWSPDPSAFVVFRGGGKSTTAEATAATLMAQQRRRFIVYLCDTQERANEHVKNIAALLTSKEVTEYYPEVGKPAINLHGNQKAWRQAEVHCANGTVIRALGFDGAMRGIKVEEFRPDAILIDDVDDITDSPEAVRKKEQVLTKSIIPARNLQNCWIGFFQNMIHNNSIMTKLVRGTADYLRNIKIIGPVKAIEDFEYDYDDRGRVVITGGTATWPAGFPLEACQRAIDEMGLEAFLTECQQDVDRMAAGAVYPMWNEQYHIATRSEVAAAFPALFTHPNPQTQQPEWSISPRWERALGHDWGSTMKHPACATWWATPSEDAPAAVQGIKHKYRSLCRPSRREEVGEMTPKWFGGLMFKAMTELERKQLRFAVMSHEAASERNTYIKEHGLRLTAAAAKRTGGIAQMQSYLAIDYTKPHPYRRYPQGHPQAGQPLQGCPRVIWVVEDGHGELELGPDGELLVHPGKGDAGMERGRWEMQRYHWDTNIAGTEKQTPYPLDNDEMDADRYVAWGYFPNVTALTAQQRVSAAVKTVSANLQVPANGEQLQGAELEQYMHTMQVAYRNAFAAEKAASRNALTRVGRRNRPRRSAGGTRGTNYA